MLFWSPAVGKSIHVDNILFWEGEAIGTGLQITTLKGTIPRQNGLGITGKFYNKLKVNDHRHTVACLK